MIAEGNLIKMHTEWNTPINYILQVGDIEVDMNALIGKEISMEYNGVINCIHCGKKTKTSFNQGFCYNCFQTAPQADESVIRPELSMAQFGVSRDMEWAKKHDLIDHYVYLSVTNDLKVGVTRHHQIPTRWIDQGATQAIKLAKTPNRHIAGVIEKFLKKDVADITKWQAMLKDEVNKDVDLLQEKNRISQLLPAELQRYIDEDNSIMELTYPGDYQLSKVKSVGFDKMPKIEGKIGRIKGQYLIFDNGTVLNIRKHNGYWVKFMVNE